MFYVHLKIPCENPFIKCHLMHCTTGRLNLHSLVVKAAAAFHNNDRLMKLVLEINGGDEPQSRSENVLYIFLFRYIFMDKGHDLRYPHGMELQVSPSPSPVLKYIISKLRVDSDRPAKVSNFVHSYCIHIWEVVSDPNMVTRCHKKFSSKHQILIYK